MSEDVTPPTILIEAWEFVRWCAAEDYRGPMPEHIRRAKALYESDTSEDGWVLITKDEHDRLLHEAEHEWCHYGVDDI